MLGGQINTSFQVMRWPMIEIKIVPRRMHCSDIVHASGVGVSQEHPLFTLKLFCGNALWNVFKLSELKNLQLLD